MILVIVLVGIVGIAMTSAFVPTMTVSVQTDSRKEAFQQGRLVMERLLREIREARGFAACAPCNPTNLLNFTDARNSPIVYAWGGAPQTAVTRNGIDIASNVDGYVITFFTRTGATPPNQTQIWRVRADLQVRVGDQTIQLRS
ncbi:MAG: hypothetical protein WAO55_08385, partial [Candidatus Manganitrophaceae bacterium]